MTIVLMADARKTDLLLNFCTAYRHILKRHNLISLFNASRLLMDVCNLDALSLATDTTASLAQLAGRASYNEIDALIYLRDPDDLLYEHGNELFQACDRNTIPYASNLATAEVLILAIDRGDLDWRELVHPDLY